MRTKDNTCCFTGHRDISNVTYRQLLDRLEPLIMRLIKNGYKYFACGGALGFDTFAATYILSLKNRGFDAELVLMLPCTDQTAKWGREDAALYEGIKARAYEVVYVSERTYFPGCMQKRNRALVDSSSACICYLSEYGGSGTRQTVEYALSKKMPVVNVAFE
ncbi:MAG: DUF1273 family protein [Clostridia bacterium]|nr:DUF1273 family protein [Clostridia bacterium]